MAVRDIRAALARSRPMYVRPDDTRGFFDDHYMVELVFNHRADPTVEIRLIYGDGYLSLTWPSGEEHDRSEWSRCIARTVEALLTGRNVRPSI